MTTRHLSMTDTLLMNIATLWIAGRGPKAPGTWGSLAAMLLAPFAFLPLPLPYRIMMLAVVFVLGSLAAARVEVIMGQKDPGCVVIDELVGLWVCYLFFPWLSPLLLAIGFVLFRIFDIAKPWPVRASETWLPGGWSVMLDDVFAGGYAGACLWLVWFVLQ
ncbi:phosphatidylglycerophosphatase A family protein [Desulfoplanes formicivorans]|uniref:Phosphatidylglycerophosphatase n=1 Tax=Desulfoplanes formicivorans TaxID=1592317 RepID=A0A194AIE4_9BACT|nr:phosphatidylglycerophosphatase A [Desulfoplanes formicivorans]GAU09098.1 phosphatidylglycerophosphatase [Desulfoplanes formicivorans]